MGRISQVPRRESPPIGGLHPKAIRQDSFFVVRRGRAIPHLTTPRFESRIKIGLG